MTPIPTYQLCTDCHANKRALATGLPGYGCLCVACYSIRMDEARKKKPPKRKPAGKTLEGEILHWTAEQRCAAGYCCGCEFCNDGNDDKLKNELDNVDKL